MQPRCTSQYSQCAGYQPAQESALGQVGKDAEWWVERLMQWYKGLLVGKRVSRQEPREKPLQSYYRCLVQRLA